MTEHPLWLPPPASLSLEIGEVHVWRVPLEQPQDVQNELLRTLNDEERDRASRFYFEKHQRRFVVARGFLRLLIGRYLETAPEALSFSYGDYGKPTLDVSSSLRFNVSHSHELALYAFTHHVEIGVDVEYIRQNFATEEIARRFFSRAEVETFASLPAEERVSAFFRCWTRKEAYIKATGRGLSQPLDEFDVTLAPDEPPALLRVGPSWSLFHLEVGEGYAGALACGGAIHELRMFESAPSCD